MNRVLHFKQTEASKVFVVSDTHWNHNPKWPIPLWKSRGYSSVEESNEHMINAINAKVGENDTLIHLGDITLNCSEEQFEYFIGSIKCKNIYLLWGNHNSPSWNIYQREVKKLYFTRGYTEYNYDSNGQKQVCGMPIELPATDIEVYPFRYKNIIFMGNYAEVTVDGKHFILGHYPIYVFNYMKDGAIHLCGHSHYNLELSKATNDTSKILDVGWDGKLEPYSVQEILDIMKTKKVLTVDHHKK